MRVDRVEQPQGHGPDHVRGGGIVADGAHHPRDDVVDRRGEELVLVLDVPVQGELMFGERAPFGFVEMFTRGAGS